MDRFFDIFFSICALFILSPLFIVVILILRFSGEGEVFYFQKRVGKDRKEISLYKFATMKKNSENIGTKTITVKDDPRVLPFGKFLRKSKINELPQLIIILNGEMSIIGPRPLTKESFYNYSENVQQTITKIRPGLSGIGSLVFRDEENLLQNKNNSVDFYKNIISPYKGELEKWYANNKSIGNYFLLIIFTALAVFMPYFDIHWRVFRSIPIPPDELKGKLNYPSN